jgi:hypothetical protein
MYCYNYVLKGFYISKKFLVLISIIFKKLVVRQKHFLSEGIAVHYNCTIFMKDKCLPHKQCLGHDHKAKVLLQHWQEEHPKTECWLDN